MHIHEAVIVESGTGRVVKSIKTTNERAARMVELGMNINLDHEFYHTEVRPGRSGDGAAIERVAEE